VRPRGAVVPSLETTVGYVSGLYLLAPTLQEGSLWPTLCLVHVLDAILCRVFARQSGYRENVWMLLGFLTGLWAVVFLLLATRRKHGPFAPPSSSSLSDHPSNREIPTVGERNKQT
jgi:hypothetical protein